MVPYLRVANVFENRIDLDDVKEMNFNPQEQATYLLKPGDILLNEGQSPHLVGRPAMYRGERAPCFFQNTLVRFRAGPRVLPGWALLVFRSQLHSRRYMRFATITTNIAHLGAERFARVEFPVPPLDIQRETVSQLELQESRLDAAVATLRRVKANLKRARASVLKAAVEGRLVSTEAALARVEGREYEPASVLLARILGERKAAWAASGARGTYAEPARAETEGLPVVPHGWCWASTDQLVQAERPICYGVLKAGDHVDGGIPIVRVTDITAKDLSLPGLKRCSPAREAIFSRARLKPGDLVVSKDGTIGQAMVVPQALDGANVTQHVLRVAPNGAVVNHFMMHALHSGRAQAWMKGETRGVALQGINVGDFRLLPLPLPPLAEQHRIVAEVDRRLSVLDAIGVTVDSNLARCTRLRQSVLKRAFEGRLCSTPTNPGQ